MNGRTKQSGLAICLIAFSLMITNMTDVFEQMFEGYFSPCGSEYPLPAFWQLLWLASAVNLTQTYNYRGRGTSIEELA